MALWVPGPRSRPNWIARSPWPARGPRLRNSRCSSRPWERVERGVTARAVFIGGEPGAGKTRLAAEVAGTLFDHGVAVLVGSSTADEDVPYAPFAEAARSAADRRSGGFDGRTVERRGIAAAAVVAEQVGRHLPDDGPAPDVGSVRQALFEAR